jgi:hypothetical protein
MLGVPACYGLVQYPRFFAPTGVRGKVLPPGCCGNGHELTPTTLCLPSAYPLPPMAVSVHAPRALRGARGLSDLLPRAGPTFEGKRALTTAPLAVASCRGARASFALAIEASAVTSTGLQVNEPGESGPLQTLRCNTADLRSLVVIPPAATRVAASTRFSFTFFSEGMKP